MARFGMVGASYSPQSIASDAQRTINFYPELVESGEGKSAAVLYGTPGLKTFCDLGGASVRGELAINGRQFSISGSTLWEVLKDGSKTNVGTVADDGKAASMAASSMQLLVASGGNIYVLQLVGATINSVPVPGGAFGMIPPNSGAGTGPLGQVIQVAYCDAYFFALLAKSNQFQISELNNASAWNDLDAYAISVFPDNASAMLVDHREIWLFGEKKTQPYYNSGDANNPWQPISGSLIEVGISSPWCATRIDNSKLWIGQDERGAGIAWRANGYTPARISNHAIEFAWSQYPLKTSDAISYAWQSNGHSFWQLYFPSGNATWVYDVATGMWHERGFWLNGRYEAHHSQCHSYAFGKHLVGDWKSGKLYETSNDIVDDDGSLIRRARRSPYVTSEGKWLNFTHLEIEAAMGQGPTPPLLDARGNARGPQMMVRWSNDQANTWSNERWESAGEVGEYALRARWSRMGRCWGTHGRVFELVVTDPIRWCIVDAYLEATPGFTPMERYTAAMRKIS